MELRADARRNYEQVLAAGRAVFAEHGTDASLREVARRAGVGIGTLYRHFPTRDALLEALLRNGVDRLRDRVDELAGELPPAEALVAWLAEFVEGSSVYHGLPASVLAALTDEKSELFASCKEMHAAGGRLLTRAQQAGVVRADLTVTEMLSLAGAVAWVTDQVPGQSGERLLSLIMTGLST